MDDPIDCTLAIETVPASPPRRRKTQLWRSVAGLAVAALISVSVFVISDRVEQFARYGYPGVFLVSLLGNATIILPAPGLTFVFALGSALNAIPVGLAAGAGGALGELTGYLAGYGGSAVIRHQALYQRFEGWMRRYGLATLLVLAIIPNPFFDIAGVAAGALRYTWWRFLLVSWLGKTIQGVLIAYAGSVSAGWVLDWLH